VQSGMRQADSKQHEQCAAHGDLQGCGNGQWPRLARPSLDFHGRLLT